MLNGKRQTRLVVLDPSVQRPLFVESELLTLAELLLVGLFVVETELFKDLEDRRADGVILVIEARNHVWEKLSLVILSVW